MKNKLALIASGGGMTCSYSVGVLLALVDKYKLTSPDIVIGGSGGTGTLSYYIAQQYNSIKNIWSNLLSTKKFINLFRFWKIIDIDYLIDEVFRKQDPLNQDKIHASNIKYLIAATNYDTGIVEYFSNKNHDDIFEAMRASKSMPLASNKIVKVKNKKYCDTYSSSLVEINILKALELGANKLIVIDNAIPEFSDLIFYFWLFFRNKNFKDMYYAYLEKKKKLKIPKNVKVIFLKPRNKLKITRLNNNQKLLKETIAQGYKETLSNKELQTFFIKA